MILSLISCVMLVSISQKRAWQPLNYFKYMKSKYFREYFCNFSSKMYYFYILGVSHLKAMLLWPTYHNRRPLTLTFKTRQPIWSTQTEVITSNIRHTWVGNKIVDHTGCSWGIACRPCSMYILASMDWAKTTARRDEKPSSFWIWCVLY